MTERKHLILHYKPFIQQGQKRDVSRLSPQQAAHGNVIIFLVAVSVRVNLLNSFSAVALTPRPVARCLWAEGCVWGWGDDVGRISYQH